MPAEPTLLTCPYCRLPLFRDATDYVCTRRHTFPIARAGYVNLLGRTRIGDNGPMLAARRRVLDAGYFLPLATALADRLMEHAPFDEVLRAGQAKVADGLIDSGCGEGYYLGYMWNRLAGAGVAAPLAAYGFDSARTAITLAARRYRTATFFVGDITRRWCLATGGSFAVLNVFAPRNYTECARVLRRHGLLLTVIPTHRHLQELRRWYHLLEIEPQKEARIRTHAQPWFTLLHTESVEYQRYFPPAVIADVVQMSPSYWHQHARNSTAPEVCDGQDVTVSVRLLIFQRT